MTLINKISMVNGTDPLWIKTNFRYLYAALIPTTALQINL